MEELHMPSKTMVCSHLFHQGNLHKCQLSRIVRESPALPHGWPKLPDKRKFGSVAHKKLQFSLRLFQNFKIIWLHFLAWCTLFVANKKRRKISCLKSLIDRSTFFPRSWSVGGGGEGIESPNQKKFFGVGRIGKSGRGGGGTGPEKVSRFEISRDWHLWI